MFRPDLRGQAPTLVINTMSSTMLEAADLTDDYILRKYLNLTSISLSLI